MASKGLSYLTSNDWVLLQSKTVRRTYRLGDEIIREGARVESLYVIRSGEASVELAGTSSRTIVATLGPNDVCGDMAFLEQSRATAAVVAKEVNVEVDEIDTQDLRAILEAFPRLASRFYLSLAVILAERLKITSRELAREMRSCDRCGSVAGVHT
jgi:extracellular factor (EF) 3-hydroxypalmitic acid methyl ester biosynthesis protein